MKKLPAVKCWWNWHLVFFPANAHPHTRAQLHTHTHAITHTHWIHLHVLYVVVDCARIFVLSYSLLRYQHKICIESYIVVLLYHTILWDMPLKECNSHFFVTFSFDHSTYTNRIMNCISNVNKTLNVNIIHSVKTFKNVVLQKSQT